jgi:hypothetical protein
MEGYRQLSGTISSIIAKRGKTETVTEFFCYSLEDLLTSELCKVKPVIVFDESGVDNNKHYLKSSYQRARDSFIEYGMENLVVPEIIQKRLEEFHGHNRGTRNMSDFGVESPPKAYEDAAKYILRLSGKYRLKMDIKPFLDDYIHNEILRHIYEHRLEVGEGLNRKSFKKKLMKRNEIAIEQFALLTNEQADDILDSYKEKKVRSRKELKDMREILEGKTSYRLLSKMHSSHNGYRDNIIIHPNDMAHFVKGLKDDDEEDINVLATALYYLVKHKDSRVVLYSHDRDLAEAVANLRGDFAFLDEAKDKDITRKVMTERRKRILGRLGKESGRLEYIGSIKGN